jgi:4-aminobutyrate aminotransferase-like enzyme
MGKMFAAEYYDVTPDLMNIAKGMGNGWPIGGVLVSEKLEGFEPVGEDAYTCMNNAAIHAAALANIDYIIDNKLPENAETMGQHITSRLKDMQKEFPEIGDIRGPGLHIGVEFVRDPQTKDPANEETAEFYDTSIEKGVFFGLAGAIDNCIKIKPPLTIDLELADKILGVFYETLKAVFRK